MAPLASGANHTRFPAELSTRPNLHAKGRRGSQGSLRLAALLDLQEAPWFEKSMICLKK
jgi:hypothetical protein